MLCGSQHEPREAAFKVVEKMLKFVSETVTEWKVLGTHYHGGKHTVLGRCD